MLFSQQEKVFVRVVFLKIGEINTVAETFSAEVFIQARWREPLFDNNLHLVSCNTQKHKLPNCNIDAYGDCVRRLPKFVDLWKISITFGIPSCTAVTRKDAMNLLQG